MGALDPSDAYHVLELSEQFLLGNDRESECESRCGIIPKMRLVNMEDSSEHQDEKKGQKEVPALHKLIHLKADQLDLSFVEKVVVSQSGIIDLCNLLLPGSANRIKDEIRLDVRSLNDNLKPLHTVGLYGSKDVMGLLLERAGIMRLAQEQLDCMESGVYGILSHDLIYLFYCHPGRRMAEASRKDVSCNFIRYLMDLCGTVYVCLDAEDVKPLLLVATPGTKPRSRVPGSRRKMLEISQPNTSENEFELRCGFHVFAPGLSNDIDSSSVKSSAVSTFDLTSRFSEGLYRCTVLTPVVCPPSKRYLEHEKDLEQQELPAIVEDWSAAYNLDLNTLPDKDLLLLLKCGKLQAHQAYLSLRHSFELRIEDNKNKFYGLEETLRQDLKSLQLIFQDILKAYRKVVYRSEEAVLASNADTWKGNRMGASSNQCAEMIAQERKLCGFWTGHDSAPGSPSLLFVGSEFIFVGDDNKVIPLSRELGCMFVVQSGRLSKSAAGPFHLQQELVARSVSTDGSSASFSFTVHSLAGDCPKGPIVTSRRVQVSGRFASPAHRNEQEFSCTVQIKLKEASSAGMLTWMQSYDRAGSIGCQGTATLPSAGTLSTSEYRDVCRSHSAKVESMIKRELLPLVREFRRFEINSQGSLLNQLFQQEESVFMNNVREQFSNARPDQPSLSIIGCHLVSSSTTQSSSAKAPQEADDKLVVRYVSEEIEQARIRWKVTELAPMKTDVERATTDRTHVIVPRCSDAHTLIELEQNVEKLTKVVAIRSGEMLVFVENARDVSTSVHLCPRLGTDVTSVSPLKVFPRLFLLIAVDETSKFVALYAREYSKVSLYKFDEAFRNMDRSNTELQLTDYITCDLISIMFIPGKREMVLIDSENRVSIFQISQGMIKPRSVVLPGPPVKAHVTTDGSCLLALYDGGDFDEDAGTRPVQDSSTSLLEIHVYVLDDELTHLKTVQVDSKEICDVKGMESSIVSFETQMHLLAFNAGITEEGIRSKILNITTSSGGCQVREVRRAKTEPEDASQKATTCPALDYVGQVFEKYATSPPLHETKRDLTIQVVLGAGIQEQAKRECITSVHNSLAYIGKQRGKDFSNLDIEVRADAFDDCFDDEDQLEGSRDDGNLRDVGDFVQTLVCLIPIQIARAEKNTLRPLSDGLQLPPGIDYTDAVSLATIIRFGFYDAVLAQWQGPIKVISSMGKQSSGKSYLLNHLSGSLLDVAGGRCTDGVWMTLRPTQNCMYVLLDFEGLGSFERSEQEDLLLSILNAAVSNITIFNKKDFNLDKETEAVFQRFQSGVRLVKNDTKLFKGMFYLAIKDVDQDDVDELTVEFIKKIRHICSKSEENFLAVMYGGHVEIAAMPPFQKQEFYDSICEIQETVEDLVAVQHNGGNLATDLKLVMAQLCAKDWSPIDTKRAALKVDLLRKHLRTAIALGRLQGKDGESLVDFDRQEAIPDLPVQLHGQSFAIPDTDLELSPYQDSQVVGSILEMLRLKFEIVFPRTGTDGEVWHSNFEKFLLALVYRRRIRVMDWLDRNTSEFQKDADVQNLRMKGVAILAELKQALALCSCKCQICFLRCVLEKSHPSEHTCMGGHVCSQICTYCSQESSGEHNDCTDVSGHEGPHDCKTRSHTCGKHCHLFEISSNCNQVCALRPSHAGHHLCNTSQHMCNQICSLPSCNNSCSYPFDAQGHDRHACNEFRCLKNCSMESCNRKCASPDHFHALGSDKHLCGYEHACKGVCEHPGACQIVTELSKISRKFSGRRGLFECEHASENKGIKKSCSIPIPIGQERHQGPHACHPEALHYCEARCQACGYICNLQSGHGGRHDTTHGHMRDVKFVSEQEEIDIVDRKYVWGESGMAEMCMLHCKAQGRGHIHLIKCGASEPGGTCAKDLYPDARHESREFGPDFKVPKDELTHAAYWRHLGFRDPCQEEDQAEFALCNHYCTSEDHEQPDAKRSFCIEKLWHDPVPPPAVGELAKFTGYVSRDGHHFRCRHAANSANHIIFVIDRSGSMSKDDIKPSMREFRNRHNNRLGCVYEAIYRFLRSRLKAQRVTSHQEDKVSIILFSEPGTAKIVEKRREIGEISVYGLINHFCTFMGTFYADGLVLAAAVMKEALVSQSDRDKEPVVIFLSDGVNDDGNTPLLVIEEMLQIDSRLVLHTILFGKKRVRDTTLQAMADSGRGRFQVSIDEVQLAKSFEGFANSLRAPVNALM